MRRGLILAAVLWGCADPVPVTERPPPTAMDFPAEATDGKSDVFGRSLVGVASPYIADPALATPLEDARLRSDHRRRREVAWQTLYKVLEPVPLLGLARGADSAEPIRLPNGEVPKVPRWETWYGVDDFKRMFQHLYEGIGPDGRAVREPFDAEAIDDVFIWNAGAAERSSQWPLDRYLKYVKDLGVCEPDQTPEACAQSIHSKFSGAALGTARIAYSPATVKHLLANYPQVLRCLDALDKVKLVDRPANETNFTACLDAEFPPDAVLVKAQWVRSDINRNLPVWDTDGAALKRRLAAESAAHWGEEGDHKADPGPSDIYTIKLRNGAVFRLAGLHVMTKELRHWQWITLWWSDTPDLDFGADRPARMKTGLDPVWSRYKMCAVSGYQEDDADPSARYGDAPSLAEALKAIASDGPAGPSWCSNPYIEHGRGNARTNCIGCHQHGGSTVAHDLNADGKPDPIDLEKVIDDEAHFPRNGRLQIREVFPADYLYSFNRVDDLVHVVFTETTHFDRADTDRVAPRVHLVLARSGDAEAGATVFAQNCVRCHGDLGQGSDRAPSLAERVPARDDDALLRTLIQGRGGMPDWGNQLDDVQLADLVAFLRSKF